MTDFQKLFEAGNVDQLARNIGPARLDITYQRFGDPASPPVLLIMGAAAQLIHWPNEFCRMLLERGLQVIRFDNRDCGCSSTITGAPEPNLQAVLAGDLSCVAYTLSDMATDAVGLLDALGIASAHVVGVSMGGQIAQVMAFEHPTRVRSLVSMMSSTGSMSIGQPAPEILAVIFGNKPPVTRDEVVAHRVKMMQAVGSPDYPTPPEEIAARAALAFDRSNDMAGMTRQAIATVASGDRVEQLRRLRVPTLVIHGLADRMCNVNGSRAVAEAIPGAELVLIEGMGHDLAPGLRPRLTALIADFVYKVEGH